MPKTSRNPSLEYTTEELDKVVDRVLRGKYEKRKPTMREILATGLTDRGAVDSYVSHRWGRYGTEELSRAGMTMRVNNIWNKVYDGYLRNLDSFDSHEAVWEVTSRYSGRSVCYTTGSKKGAIQWAETMFRWTLQSNERLDAHFTSLGGVDRAAILNLSLIPNIQEEISGCEKRVQEWSERADKWRISLDALAGVARHMAGETAG